MINFNLQTIQKIVDEVETIVIKDEYMLEERMLCDTLRPAHAVFYEMARKLRPQLMLATGDPDGMVGASFASGCLDADSVYSEVVMFQTNAMPKPGWDTVSRLCEMYPNLTNATPEEFMWLPRVVRGIRMMGAPDLLYINGSFHYPMALPEWYAYIELLAPVSLVLFDGMFPNTFQHRLEFLNLLGFKYDSAYSEKLHLGYLKRV